MNFASTSSLGSTSHDTLNYFRAAPHRIFKMFKGESLSDDCASLSMQVITLGGSVLQNYLGDVFHVTCGTRTYVITYVSHDDVVSSFCDRSRRGESVPRRDVSVQCVVANQAGNRQPLHNRCDTTNRNFVCDYIRATPHHSARAALSLLAVAAVSAQQNIVQVAQATPELRLLVDALIAGNLTGALSVRQQERS